MNQTYKKLINLYDDNIGKVEYVNHMGDDLTIVNAARVSFGKHKITMDNDDKKLIRYLMKNKHTSTLEHNIVTFRFTVPLFICAQHLRHRTWSFNQISRRYTNENIKFYEPKTFRSQHESNRQASKNDEIDPFIKMNDYLFDDHTSCMPQSNTTASRAIKLWDQRSVEFYNALLDAGVCREQARSVLPQNLYTEYYGTVNFNNLLKYIVLRDDEHAQLEHQMVAKACRTIATDLWAIAMQTFNELRNNA